MKKIILSSLISILIISSCFVEKDKIITETSTNSGIISNTGNTEIIGTGEINLENNENTSKKVENKDVKNIEPEIKNKNIIDSKNTEKNEAKIDIKIEDEVKIDDEINDLLNGLTDILDDSLKQ